MFCNFSYPYGILIFKWQRYFFAIIIYTLTRTRAFSRTNSRYSLSTNTHLAVKRARRIHTYCIIGVVLSHNNKNDCSVLFRNDTRRVYYVTITIGVWETVWCLSRTDPNVTFLTAPSEHKCQMLKAVIEKYIHYVF